jgi:hypothetical protein
MRSSLSVAAVTVVNSTIIGSPDGHDCPFQVAHPFAFPCLLSLDIRRFLRIRSKKNHITEATDRTIIEAVFGTSVGMIKNRIKRINRAAGGPRVVEMWDANQFVFLSNEADVLREMRAFLAGLP